MTGRLPSLPAYDEAPLLVTMTSLINCLANERVDASIMYYMLLYVILCDSVQRKYVKLHTLSYQSDFHEVSWLKRWIEYYNASEFLRCRGFFLQGINHRIFFTGKLQRIFFIGRLSRIFFTDFKILFLLLLLTHDWLKKIVQGPPAKSRTCSQLQLHFRKFIFFEIQALD